MCWLGVAVVVVRLCVGWGQWWSWLGDGWSWQPKFGWLYVISASVVGFLSLCSN